MPEAKGIVIDEGNGRETSPGAPGPALTRKNYIICIGIGSYKLPEYDLGQFCVNDCTDLAELLANDYSFEIVKGQYDNNFEPISTAVQVLYDEAGTKENIDKLFSSLAYHPDFTKQQGDHLPTHNLVIFYSGHGASLSNDIGNSFYWVPYNYSRGRKSPPDPGGLFNVHTLITTQLTNIRYHSLMLITDACHSAGTFNINNWAYDVNVPPNVPPEEERSAWAICSSAANQQSYALPNDRNSLFTTNLLGKLRLNPQERLSIESLGVELKKDLANSPQRTFSGRLNIITGVNTGVFEFHASPQKKKKIAAFRRKPLLKRHLINLNYHDQVLYVISKINQARNGLNKNTKIHLMLMSAAPRYGLMMAHRLISTSTYFPITPYRHFKPEPIYLHKQEDLIGGVDENTVVKILSRAMGLDKEQQQSPTRANADLLPAVDSKAEFTAALLKRLQAKHVLVEIRIEQETVTPKTIAEFVKKLYTLLSELKYNGDNLNRLCVLVLDQNPSDYNALIGNFSGDNVEPYLIPKIKSLEDLELQKWYDMAGVAESGAAETQTYNELLDEFFNEAVALAPRDEDGLIPPGSFIQTLCEKSDCCDLAIEYLNF